MEALLDATAACDLAAVTALLDGGAALDDRDEGGYSALHVAVKLGHDEIARALLARHANVNSRCHDGSCPLKEAARVGAVDRVRALLDVGARVDLVDYQGLPPIYWAIEGKHRAVVELLLERGAYVHPEWHSRDVQLDAFLAAQIDRREEAIRDAIEDGLRSDAADDIVTALRRVGELGHPACFIESVYLPVGLRLQVLVAEQDWPVATRVFMACADALPRLGHTRAYTSHWGEELISTALVLAMLSHDPAIERVVFELMPERVTGPSLAYNLACYYARRHDANRMLRFIRVAKDLGKDPDAFRTDADFQAYWEDPQFDAAVDGFHGFDTGAPFDDEPFDATA